MSIHNTKLMEAALAPVSQIVSDEWEEALAKAIEEMNEKYAVVFMGGSSVIVSIERDPVLGGDRLVISRPQDLKLQYANRRYIVGYTKKGHPIYKDLGSAWIGDLRRRTFDGIGLYPNGNCPPNILNQWRGYGVEPKVGDWSTIETHLLEVICSANQDHYTWLIGWMAYAVQHPERQAEVAVVLRGKKGTGKGQFGRLCMKLFCHHALQITNSRYLTGHFNSHLANVVFLFVDEALFAGDKASESVLKGLITEDRLVIEPKGVNAFQMPNRLTILMASNADRVVPASADERRYFVLDVSDHRRSDRVYFDSLATAIEGDELPALLDYLLTYDLTDWDQRYVPHTAALDMQKLLGDNTVMQFWYDCLSTGELIGVDGLAGQGGWPSSVPVQSLHRAYQTFTRDHGDRHPVRIQQMARKLGALSPGGKLGKARPSSENRLRHYKLASLADHRAAFLKAMEIDPADHSWDDGG